MTKARGRYSEREEECLARTKHLMRLIGTLEGKIHVRLIGRTMVAVISWPDGKETMGAARVSPGDPRHIIARFEALNEAYLRRVGGDEQ